MTHDFTNIDSFAACRQTVELLANSALEMQASNAWSQHVVGAYADRNPAHAGFLFWDAVRQRIGDGTADKWDVA